MGCSIAPTKQQQLDPIELPAPPSISARLPTEAMQDCREMLEPYTFSVLTPAEQSTAIVNYVLTLYAGYADCSLRHNQLKEWIQDEHGNP